MPELTLVIGNKNYSSWSLRPWLVLRHFGVPFEEVRLPLDTREFELNIGRYSPSGRVPVLLDGGLRVWESLAICEYVAERYVMGEAWPGGREARAVARAVSCEMLAGFAALRSELPMNCRERRTGVVPTPAARADIDRITALWHDCRSRWGEAGPWLFGEFSIADAMYAPVALRFDTYGVDLSGETEAYVSTVLAHPALQEWVAEGRAEIEVLEAEERGTPARF